MIYRSSLDSLVRRVRSTVPGVGSVADDDDGRADESSDSDAIDETERRAIETEAERVRYNPEAADFDVVVDALDSDDPECRLLGARALAGTPATSRPEMADAVPALVRGLDDDRLSVRRYCARALARIAPGDPAAIRAEAPALAEHVTDHNLRVSGNVGAALAEAAASFPDEIAPLVSPYVDTGIRTRARRNALSVLERAATADPESVEPIVPSVVELLDGRLADRAALCRALAPIADEYPDLVAPAVPDLASYAAREGDNDPAIETLARLALADPSVVREAVPTLTAYLAGADPSHGDLVARALVRIVDEHPAERDRVLDELASLAELDRLMAGRRLARVGGDLGAEIAEEALEGSSLRRYVGR